MEEQQILAFIRRARMEEPLQKELTTDSERVLVEQGFSPAVAEVVRRVVPHLTVADEPPTHNNWWR